MGAGVPSREEIVHRALVQLGCISDEELVAFVAREYGVSVEARFVPIFRASLRAREVLERARAKAREATNAGNADKDEGDIRPGESTSRSA
jgi:hypothetical protein